MQIRILFVIIFTAISALGNTNSSAVSHLNDHDLKVYYKIKSVCSSGTYTSAFKLAFNSENLMASINNSLDIVSLNFYEALSNRIQAGGLTPEMKALRNSQGFWLAMVDCYGYKYGELNRGNLVKQLIDLGHLSTETIGVMAGVTVVKFGALAGKALMTQYPLALKFISVGVISYMTSQLVNYLYWTHPISMTEKDHQDYVKMKEQVFAEPDRAIQQVVITAKSRILLLETQLNTEQDLSKRKELQVKIEKLKSSLDNLYQLNPKLKSL